VKVLVSEIADAGDERSRNQAGGQHHGVDVEWHWLFLFVTTDPARRSGSMRR
jgi:hypothetical protein